MVFMFFVFIFIFCVFFCVMIVFRIVVLLLRVCSFVRVFFIILSYVFIVSSVCIFFGL